MQDIFKQESCIAGFIFFQMRLKSQELSNNHITLGQNISASAALSLISFLYWFPNFIQVKCHIKGEYTEKGN